MNEAEREATPCPFCGSDNISDGETLTSDPDGATYTQSECRGCGALGPAGFLEPGEIDYGSEKAIAAWNRRARTTAIPPALSDEQQRLALKAVSMVLHDIQWGDGISSESISACIEARAILAASLPREPEEKEKS